MGKHQIKVSNPHKQLVYNEKIAVVVANFLNPGSTLSKVPPVTGSEKLFLLIALNASNIIEFVVLN